jgi:hypothetical protein
MNPNVCCSSGSRASTSLASFRCAVGDGNAIRAGAYPSRATANASSAFHSVLAKVLGGAPKIIHKVPFSMDPV